VKLSEAILLGSIGSEQGFGAYSGYKNAPRKCAIGAALLATHNETEDLPIFELEKIWPWTTSRKFTSPVDSFPSNIPFCVSNMIWYLNDSYRWTRPQIAAWVATIEPVEPEEAGIAENINLAEYADSTPGLTSLGVECQG